MTGPGPWEYEHATIRWRPRPRSGPSSADLQGPWTTVISLAGHDQEIERPEVAPGGNMAASLVGALNRLADDGWELAGAGTWERSGSWYTWSALLRRARPVG